MKIAIIPARAGSQRIPGKNKRMFHGQPIIKYSIDTAKASGLFDLIVVSTDDHEIASIASARGALAVYRDADYAKDEVGTQSVISHCLDQIKAVQPDYVCGIYATAPLLLPDDLRRGYRILSEAQEKPGHTLHYAMAVNEEPLFDAGLFYWGTTRAFLDRKPLITAHTAMIPISKKYVCDINTEDDWERAEQMYAELHGIAGDPVARCAPAEHDYQLQPSKHAELTYFQCTKCKHVLPQ